MLMAMLIVLVVVLVIMLESHISQHPSAPGSDVRIDMKRILPMRQRQTVELPRSPESTSSFVDLNKESSASGSPDEDGYGGNTRIKVA